MCAIAHRLDLSFSNTGFIGKNNFTSHIVPYWLREAHWTTEQWAGGFQTKVANDPPCLFLSSRKRTNLSEGRQEHSAPAHAHCWSASQVSHPVLSLAIGRISVRNAQIVFIRLVSRGKHLYIFQLTSVKNNIAKCFMTLYAFWLVEDRGCYQRAHLAVVADVTCLQLLGAIYTLLNTQDHPFWHNAKLQPFVDFWVSLILVWQVVKAISYLHASHFHCLSIPAILAWPQWRCCCMSTWPTNSQRKAMASPSTGIAYLVLCVYCVDTIALHS